MGEVAYVSNRKARVLMSNLLPWQWPIPTNFREVCWEIANRLMR
jgi:hypothetical protein